MAEQPITFSPEHFAAVGHLVVAVSKIESLLIVLSHFAMGRAFRESAI
jgi:hypothetical protein